TFPPARMPLNQPRSSLFKAFPLQILVPARQTFGTDSTNFSHKPKQPAGQRAPAVNAPKMQPSRARQMHAAFGQTFRRESALASLSFRTDPRDEQTKTI